MMIGSCGSASRNEKTCERLASRTANPIGAPLTARRLVTAPLWIYAQRGMTVAILTVHAIFLLWADWYHSPAWDELGHLAAGLSHWQTGEFDAYRVNPPLIRSVATLPLRFVGPELTSSGASLTPFDRQEFWLAGELVRQHGSRVFVWCSIARMVCIPLSLLGGIVASRWASELFGRRAGSLAVTMWCFSPTILANAQMITPDVGAASLGLTASYAFWKWLCRPTLRRASVTGVVLGFAEAAKFTWVVLFVLWPVMWVIWRIGRSGARAGCGWRWDVGQMVLMFAFAVCVINLAYGFEATGTRLGDFRFVSRTLTRGTEYTPQAGESVSRNCFANSWLEGVPVPLPANYVLGIDLQKRDFEEPMWSYLRGEWQKGGWWYYYLYALALKVPLGTWMLAALTAGLSVVRRTGSPGSGDEVLLLVPAIAVLLLVSSQTGFNHHFRYVLPIVPFGLVWISRAARLVDRKTPALALVVVLAAAWSVGSSLHVYPHSHAYFNELAGGPDNGARHLLDSNIDWGQDLLPFKRWLMRHPEVHPIGLAYSIPNGLLDPAAVGIRCAEPPRDAESLVRTPQRSRGEFGPLPGWYAIFVRELYERHRKYQYFHNFRPVERIGYTVYIYHITRDDANRVRREIGLPEVREESRAEGEG